MDALYSSPLDKVGAEAVADDVLCELARGQHRDERGCRREKEGRTHAVLLGQGRDNAGGKVLDERVAQEDKVVVAAACGRRLAAVAWEVGL